jgi:hypothetical protein
MILGKANQYTPMFKADTNIDAYLLEKYPLITLK